MKTETTAFPHVEYDEITDVLYVSLSDPKKGECLLSQDIGAAYRLDTEGNVIGVTIINFKEQFNAT